MTEQKQEKHLSYILQLLQSLRPITLSQMSGIRLMNRTDTKFVTNVELLYKMLEMIQDSYYVQDIDGVRLADYKTLYFDFPNHYFYNIHHNGKYPRQKVRVRTYADSDISFLEIKRKNNHRRTSKIRLMVPGADRIQEANGDLFLRENLQFGLSDLIPAVSNHFRRMTLVNEAKTERLTIDLDLSFKNHETGCEACVPNLVIVELKRDGLQPSPILGVLKKLRIKPLGFSKYCIGSALTNKNLKQNRLKMRLHEISRRNLI